AGTSVEDIPSWDTIEAVWMRNPYDYNTAYIRFRNGDNPNGAEKNIRTAPEASGQCPLFYDGGHESGTFVIKNKNYITVTDLKIQGGTYQVLVTGSSAYNIIQNSEIKNGWTQVLLGDTASSNIVRNNVIHQDHFGNTTFPGFLPGASHYEAVGDPFPY